MGGSSLVQTHVQNRSLDLDPKTREIMLKTELEAAILTTPMTQLIIVRAPVMDMEADATMLRLVPAPVTDMGADAAMLRLVPAPVTCTGVDTTMDPSSEDERAAKVHVYQTPRQSAHGKGLRYFNIGEVIGAIDDSHYNQRSNVNMTNLLYT